MSSDTENSSNDSIEPEINDEEIKQEEVPVLKKINKKIPKSKIIKSECGTDVVLKYKTKPKKSAPIVVYYEDLEIEKSAPKVIIKKKKARGRPKSKAMIEYVDDDGLEVQDKMEATQTIINAPVKEKCSAKELKTLELQAKIAELEAVSGKKIRATRKGKIDGRQAKPPSEKQLASRKKFVEDNKLRAQKKRDEKKLLLKEEVKQDVKIVIDELSLMKQEAMRSQNEASELKAKILKEEKERLEKEKENKKYGGYGDDIFK